MFSNSPKPITRQLSKGIFSRIDQVAYISPKLPLNTYRNPSHKSSQAPFKIDLTKPPFTQRSHSSNSITQSKNPQSKTSENQNCMTEKDKSPKESITGHKLEERELVIKAKPKDYSKKSVSIEKIKMKCSGTSQSKQRSVTPPPYVNMISNKDHTHYTHKTNNSNTHAKPRASTPLYPHHHNHPASSNTSRDAVISQMKRKLNIHSSNHNSASQRSNTQNHSNNLNSRQKPINNAGPKVFEVLDVSEERCERGLKDMKNIKPTNNKECHDSNFKYYEDLHKIARPSNTSEQRSQNKLNEANNRLYSDYLQLKQEREKLEKGSKKDNWSSISKPPQCRAENPSSKSMRKQSQNTTPNESEWSVAQECSKSSIHKRISLTNSITNANNQNSKEAIHKRSNYHSQTAIPHKSSASSASYSRSNSNNHYNNGKMSAINMQPPSSAADDSSAKSAGGAAAATSVRNHCNGGRADSVSSACEERSLNNHSNSNASNLNSNNNSKGEDSIQNNINQSMLLLHQNKKLLHFLNIEKDVVVKLVCFILDLPLLFF